MHLIIFDVDGTLTRTTTVDAACYERAVSTHLGIRIDTDWSTYRHATDAGVLIELLGRHGIPESPSGLAAVRHRFLELLAAAVTADPDCCREVPGARAVIEHLRELPSLQLAIATGAWADSARLKLRHADIPAEQLPFASSDDSPSRERILQIAFERAAARTQTRIDAVTCIGDALWDLSAARSLGFHFVGIACNGDSSRLRSAGAAVVFPDFTDRDAFLRQLLAG
jgi:phosphoglycolate phosphatase-like HAD superfamily hydrolase